MLTFELFPAAIEHLAGVRALLASADLPTLGVEEQFPAAFVIARRQHELVGAAGLERHGEVGLLRSVVVAEHCRGTGTGHALVRDRLEAARAAQLEWVFLLTMTAGTYFEKLGFVATTRAEVPAELASSTEFARACSTSAACFVYRP